MKTLFSCTVGSRLYGISNEDSDFDFKGFGLPEVDELVGLKTWEQSIFKDEIKKEEGTIYSLKKFLGLSMKGNPTILEISFVKPEHIIFSTELGESVRKFIRENCITKDLFKAYSAYFRAQVAKLQRPDREGKRQELIDKYGFDTKFAAHAYRLGIQACEIMMKGSLNPTLNDSNKKICLSIRRAEKTKEEILQLLTSLDGEMYEVYKQSTLPEKPDFNLINDFLTNIHLNYLKGSYELGS